MTAPTTKVESVQPVSHHTAFEGRSEASIRITATIAHGLNAQTTASGSSSRKSGHDPAEYLQVHPMRVTSPHGARTTVGRP